MAFPHLAYVRTRGIAFLQPCARERRYFRGENCYTSPPDGLTAGTLRVFGLRGYVSRSIYQLKLVSLTQQKIPVSKGRDYKSSIYHSGGGFSPKIANNRHQQRKHKANESQHQQQNNRVNIHDDKDTKTYLSRESKSR